MGKVSRGDSDPMTRAVIAKLKRYDPEDMPKVKHLLQEGHVDDKDKRYKVLEPLKIPYSQLPEHLRPGNWMKDYKLVPKEKPEYRSMNFETPVTTNDPTPDRVVDVDAPNPAFYTRPPTASPPPRPIVHVMQHTYRFKPSKQLEDMLTKAAEGAEKMSELKPIKKKK